MSEIILSRAEVVNRPSIVYKEVTQYDKDGEIVSHSVTKARSRNGSGFVISYTSKMDEFIKTTTNPTVIRLFLYLAHHQGYGVDGVFGYRCSRQHLRDTLHVTRKSVYSALDYLFDKFLVNEIRVAGVYEYMVNPDFITVGTDKKQRVREWIQRWEFYWKRKHKVIPEVENYEKPSD